MKITPAILDNLERNLPKGPVTYIPKRGAPVTFHGRHILQLVKLAKRAR